MHYTFLKPYLQKNTGVQCFRWKSDSTFWPEKKIKSNWEVQIKYCFYSGICAMDVKNGNITWILQLYPVESLISKHSGKNGRSLPYQVSRFFVMQPHIGSGKALCDVVGVPSTALLSENGIYNIHLSHHVIIYIYITGIYAAMRRGLCRSKHRLWKKRFGSLDCWKIDAMDVYEWHTI